MTMTIGLDYDDTYTLDPFFWNDFIRRVRQRGHRVYIVTWRSESESVPIYLQLGDFVDGIYPTDRKAKQPFMYKQGIHIDVWIDDNPRAVVQDMQPYHHHNEGE